MSAPYPTRMEKFRCVWRGRRWPTFALDVLFALLELLYVPDLYEACTTLFAPTSRKLSTRERALLYPFFGDSVPYDKIRIDERAHLGPRWKRFCYVSFHTINSWGPMTDPTLVHEVVHVWQYTHRGAAYIPRALYAQGTVMGYNYGGLSALENGRKLEDFNYEQQADIVEDAFRIVHHYRAQWVPAGRGAEVLHYYQRYLDEIRNGNRQPC